MKPRRKPSSRIANAKLPSFSLKKRKLAIHQHVTKGAIKRLARRGGVKRISGLIYNQIRDVLKLYLTSLVRDSITYCNYHKRTTVMGEDVLRALNCRGKRLYGFDDKPFPISIKTSVRMVDDGDTPPQSTSSVTRPPSSRLVEFSDSSLLSPPNVTRSSSVRMVSSDSNLQSPPNVTRSSSVRMVESSDSNLQSTSSVTRSSSARLIEGKSNPQNISSVTRLSTTRLRNNSELTAGMEESSVGRTVSADSQSRTSTRLQSKKSTVQGAEEDTTEDSDSTVENLSLQNSNRRNFPNSNRRNFPNSNDSVQVIDSEDDFDIPIRRK